MAQAIWFGQPSRALVTPGLPIAWAGVTLGGILTCYWLAVSSGHARSWFPCPCSIFVEYPEFYVAVPTLTLSVLGLVANAIAMASFMSMTAAEGSSHGPWFVAGICMSAMTCLILCFLIETRVELIFFAIEHRMLARISILLLCVYGIGLVSSLWIHSATNPQIRASVWFKTILLVLGVGLFMYYVKLFYQGHEVDEPVGQTMWIGLGLTVSFVLSFAKDFSVASESKSLKDDMDTFNTYSAASKI
eukprot:TRINITY_DN42283_c0_g1_i1.p1 TRINITY_DN42283_c0_g1~~TRINITY_DN42283_c0_g1_i1.p1  ORF type:complete len:246 (+),score=17.11 TRINITY_DN42283_c0_g1_i1:68-805(+)